MNKTCVECGCVLVLSHSHKKYCSGKCKARYRKKNGGGSRETGHNCRVCGVWFPLNNGQHNKWLCSPECRRSSNAKSVREFHLRRPDMEVIYRERARDKQTVDSTMARFYLWNPSAPKECESCKERRVLEIAHKPGYERLGERRKKANQVWPLMVWVLCPTCHRLLDRMNYSPQELGLEGTS